MTILLVRKRVQRRPGGWLALVVVTVAAASILYAQGKAPGPAGGPPAGAGGKAGPPGAPGGGTTGPAAGKAPGPGAGGPPGGVPTGGGAPGMPGGSTSGGPPGMGGGGPGMGMGMGMGGGAAVAPTVPFELDPVGGPDCISFDKVSITGLKKYVMTTAGGKPEEILEFSYYDPHPDYARRVRVQMPAYFTQEKRTKPGWYARFRWWEMKPDWSEAERTARISGVEHGSSYVTHITPRQYLPNWLTIKPNETPEEATAALVGAEVGSRYVLGR